jgi:multidrug efflux pump subunit AcrA (membrane-fusion protein)
MKKLVILIVALLALGFVSLSHTVKTAQVVPVSPSPIPVSQTLTPTITPTATVTATLTPTIHRSISPIRIRHEDE